MKRFINFFLFLSLYLFLICSHVSAVDFPARSNPKYNKVPYIEIYKLHQDYAQGKAVIVDVRSKIEFDTIHIKGAVHVPLSSTLFEAHIKKLTASNQNKKIIFYCNGTTCLKSYEAQKRASASGIENTFAFDLGIPGWAEDFPEKTILLGKPMSVSNIKWIPKSEFKAKCVSWSEFRKKSREKNIKVIDARDNVQKGKYSKQKESALTAQDKMNLKQFIQKNRDMIEALSSNKKVVSQPIDKLIKNIIHRGMLKNETLLIFDQVGKQVRWLMYQLEAAGYSNYYFLDKGAYNVIGMQAYR